MAKKRLYEVCNCWGASTAVKLSDAGVVDGRREARDDRYSIRRLRSVSRSASPRDDRNYRSRRHSRPLSRSVSPYDEENQKKTHQSPNSRENGQARYADAPRGSRSPRRNSRSPARSRSRSHRFVVT
ncbi:hypothetical protein PHJA_000331900 [Phtheirospermum japonicum]|uniref:Uncharacterized protein n=1 Tax=Phtheirospermum japonicum TaxID=374723 RepID=A0A830B4T0_9LAMI|nr:hypothetical protein PHJA_000331900 [Phtheirospermum japonicum]